MFKLCLESKGETSHLNTLILLDLTLLETVLQVGELSFPMKHINASPDPFVYMTLLSHIKLLTVPWIAFYVILKNFAHIACKDLLD